MFGYMTDLETVEIDESKTVEVEIEGQWLSIHFIHLYVLSLQLFHLLLFSLRT